MAELLAAAADLQPVQSGDELGVGPNAFDDVAQPASAHDAEGQMRPSAAANERLTHVVRHHGIRRLVDELGQRAVEVGQHQRMPAFEPRGNRAGDPGRCRS